MVKIIGGVVFDGVFLLGEVVDGVGFVKWDVSIVGIGWEGFCYFGC